MKLESAITGMALFAGMPRLNAREEKFFKKANIGFGIEQVYPDESKRKAKQLANATLSLGDLHELPGDHSISLSGCLYFPFDSDTGGSSEHPSWENAGHPGSTNPGLLLFSADGRRGVPNLWRPVQSDHTGRFGRSAEILLHASALQRLVPKRPLDPLLRRRISQGRLGALGVAFAFFSNPPAFYAKAYNRGQADGFVFRHFARTYRAATLFLSSLSRFLTKAGLGHILPIANSNVHAIRKYFATTGQIPGTKNIH